jgi:hypothetical protein
MCAKVPRQQTTIWQSLKELKRNIVMLAEASIRLRDCRFSETTVREFHGYWSAAAAGQMRIIGMVSAVRFAPA